MKLFISTFILFFSYGGCKNGCGKQQDFNVGINKLNKNLPTREQNLREQEKRWRNQKK